MPSVDIVVPCYKYGHFLRECLSSILTQDAGEIRVLLIDDASPDDSYEVACEIAASDRRVEALRHETNKGLIGTLNEGIDWASADYFMVLSADDLLVPGSFRRAFDVLEEHPDVGFFHGAEAKLYPGEPLPSFDHEAQAGASTRVRRGEDLLRELCGRAENFVGISTAILRTEAQKKAGYYDPKLPHTSDFDMWLRVAAITDVGETDAVQGIRRHHAASMSVFYFSEILRDYAARKTTFDSFFAGAGQALPQSKRLYRLARHRLAEEAYWVGLSRTLRGQREVGTKLVEFAVRLDPSLAVVPPIDYLFRRKGSFRRLVEVAMQIVARRAERVAS